MSEELTRRRQFDRILNATYLESGPRRFTDRHLLWAAFQRETGTWRQGFDAHVKRWSRLVSEETHLRFHTDPTFARHYDACRAVADDLHNDWIAGLRWGSATLGEQLRAVGEGDRG